MENEIIIASCQLPDVHDDMKRSIALIIEYAKRADDLGAKLVCFPECFLQGYVVDHQARKRALDLSSGAFQEVLAKIVQVDPVLVVGLIELEGGKLYNSAVVVKKGKLVGVYRKANLVGPENDTFEPGHECPIFQFDNMRFGINICYDLNYAECAASVSRQGADLLVCPCNNMLPHDIAEDWKHKHNEIRSRRSIETGLWLLSSDVTGETQSRISYGPTALIDPNGVVVKQVPLLEPGLLVHGIWTQAPPEP